LSPQRQTTPRTPGAYPSSVERLASSQEEPPLHSESPFVQATPSQFDMEADPVEESESEEQEVPSPPPPTVLRRSTRQGRGQRGVRFEDEIYERGYLTVLYGSTNGSAWKGPYVDTRQRAKRLRHWDRSTWPIGSGPLRAVGDWATRSSVGLKHGNRVLGPQ